MATQHNNNWNCSIETKRAVVSPKNMWFCIWASFSLLWAHIVSWSLPVSLGQVQGNVSCGDLLTQNSVFMVLPSPGPSHFLHFLAALNADINKYASFLFVHCSILLEQFSYHCLMDLWYKWYSVVLLLVVNIKPNN